MKKNLKLFLVTVVTVFALISQAALAADTDGYDKEINFGEYTLSNVETIVEDGWTKATTSQTTGAPSVQINNISGSYIKWEGKLKVNIPSAGEIYLSSYSNGSRKNFLKFDKWNTITTADEKTKDYKMNTEMSFEIYIDYIGQTYTAFVDGTLICRDCSLVMEDPSQLRFVFQQSGTADNVIYFKDVKVSAVSIDTYKTIFEDDFESYTAENPLTSKWKNNKTTENYETGATLSGSNTSKTLKLGHLTEILDMSPIVRASAAKQTITFDIYFESTNKNRVYLKADNTTNVGIFDFSEAPYFMRTGGLNDKQNFKTGEWNTVKIEFDDGKFTSYINGVSVGGTSVTAPTSFSITRGGGKLGAFYIDNFKWTADDANKDKVVVKKVKTGSDIGKAIFYYRPTEAKSLTMLVAQYNESGALTSVKPVVNAAAADTGNMVSLPIDYNKNQKIFIWSDLSEIQPVQPSIPVD